uniref:small monomeric GTPase n=1 Tax=Electrophorus electricus TaxID=8005 RepID=A0A4W4HA58_ELEEL
MGTQGSPVKSYDYLLKFLLVGDSDVGKGEILDSLQDGSAESPYAYSSGIDYKTTTILLDGRRVKLELWDTSGQGRFCTIFRSYSRGAQVRMTKPRGHLLGQLPGPCPALPRLPAAESSSGLFL